MMSRDTVGLWHSSQSFGSMGTRMHSYHDLLDTLHFMNAKGRFGCNPSTRAMSAEVEHNPSANEHNTATDGFQQEEARVGAVCGRYYRCADCQKGRHKTDAAHEPTHDRTARDHRHACLATRRSAPQHRQGCKDVKEWHEREDDRHVDKHDIGLVDRGTRECGEQDDRREYALGDQ